MSIIATIFLIKMIEAALAGFIFATVVILTLLNFDRIINWLRARTKIKLADRDNIAFSLCGRTKEGNYSTIYGIYNLREDEIKDAESVKSTNIDGELKARHSQNNLIVYE